MIWLVGGDGMLGAEVRSVLEERRLDHFSTDVEVDIASEDEVLRIALGRGPDWIVNCAAYTAVDRAETEEERARAVNAVGAGNLARAADRLGARLIQVSTDYVFSGSKDGAYEVDDPVDPAGAYGRTKAAGEALVRTGCERHFIVRTAWLHGPRGPNFVATMLRLMAERPSLRVVDDQRGSPTYAADLASTLTTFIAREEQAYGTYHYANDGACTWHAFAKEIQRQALGCGLLTSAVPIEAIPTAAYPTPATRPANSVLSTARIRAGLGLSIPSWQDGLERHLRRLERGHVNQS